MYGIRGIAVYADGLRAVVSDCGKAAKSSDGRDKYFLSAAGEFDDSPAALASSIAELGDALPKLESCGVHAFSRQRKLRNFGQLHKQVVARVGSASALSTVDAEDLDGLLTAARSTIVSIRGALA